MVELINSNRSYYRDECKCVEQLISRDFQDIKTIRKVLPPRLARLFKGMDWQIERKIILEKYREYVKK